MDNCEKRKFPRFEFTPMEWYSEDSRRYDRHLVDHNLILTEKQKKSVQNYIEKFGMDNF